MLLNVQFVSLLSTFLALMMYMVPVVLNRELIGTHCAHRLKDENGKETRSDDKNWSCMQNVCRGTLCHGALFVIAILTSQGVL